MVKLNPIMQQAQNLRTSMMYSFMTGNYKEYREASKEYAKIGVKHFDELCTLPKNNVSVSLFSKVGMRMLKVYILNLFSKKTPEEKEFAKLASEYKKRKEAERYITTI